MRLMKPPPQNLSQTEMEKLTLTTEDKIFTHTQDKDWNGKEIYEISEVPKSL